MHLERESVQEFGIIARFGRKHTFLKMAKVTDRKMWKWSNWLTKMSNRKLTTWK